MPQAGAEERTIRIIRDSAWRTQRLRILQQGQSLLRSCVGLGQNGGGRLGQDLCSSQIRRLRREIRILNRRLRGAGIFVGNVQGADR